MKKRIFPYITSIMLTILANWVSAQSQPFSYSSEPPDSIVELETYLPFCEEKQSVKVAVYDGMAVMEGDILLGSLKELRQRKPLPANEKGLFCDVCPVWQGSIIPYRIEPGNFTPGYEALIRQAAEYISQNTNLCLIERTDEIDYVSLIASDGCWSYVGRIGGVQPLGLNDSSDGSGCGLGAIIHEFTHAAGHWHEQSREDRDQNVYILWQNITPGYEANFYQHISDGMDHGSYDFYSIMHYGPYAFSKNGQPTILRNDFSTNLGGGAQYTQGDVDAINFNYPLVCDCGNGGGCMAPVGQVNKVAVGNFSRFVSKEMHGNYKLAEATYIAHRKEIDAMLDGNDPAHAKVRDAWAKFQAANAGTFLKAFLTKEKNQVTPSAVDALRHLLGELAKVARSKELKADIAKYQQLLGVTVGKDLKAALIAFDRAVPEKIVTSSRTSQEVAQVGSSMASLRHNPVVGGGEATLSCTLPTEGRLTIRLWSLDARPVRFILLEETVAAGTGEYPIDTGGLPPGVYLVRVEFASTSDVALHQQQVLRLVVQ